MKDFTITTSGFAVWTVSEGIRMVNWPLAATIRAWPKEPPSACWWCGDPGLYKARHNSTARASCRDHRAALIRWQRWGTD